MFLYVILFLQIHPYNIPSLFSPQISEAIKRLLRLSAVGVAAVFPPDLTSYSQLAENVTISTSTTTTTTTTLSPLPQAADEDTASVQFRALQYALFSTSFVEIIGGVFFLLTAMYILRDRRNVERAVAGKTLPCDKLSSSNSQDRFLAALTEIWKIVTNHVHPCILIVATSNMLVANAYKSCSSRSNIFCVCFFIFVQITLRLRTRTQRKLIRFGNARAKRYPFIVISPSTAA